VDRYPESRFRENAWQAFSRLAELDLKAALKIGGAKGQYDKVPYLRFSDAAAAEFLEWRGDLECRLRAGDMSPALEGHVAKYRKLVPALALINHLADAGEGPVSEEALVKALALTKYAESHARRVYGASDAVEVAAARAILKHIHAGDIADGFTARDVHRHGWSHLTDRDHIQFGLDLLVDLDHLAGRDINAGERGGRPKVIYMINPASKP
jgi:putative DNA primase/helicase